jgi:hypothetical protein
VSRRTCGRCPAQVLWARLPSGKTMPLDPAPDPAGTVAAYRDGLGAWRAHVLTDGERPAPFEKRYVTHFATCAPTVALRQGLRDGSVIDLRAARAKRGLRR